MRLKTVVILSNLVFMLVSCATNNSRILSSKSGKVNLPNVQKFNLPGGNTSNWRYLGTTDDNLIANEINDSSIESNRDGSYKYQDRKTIVNPDLFTYSPQQPRYKFALGMWLMDCSNRQYLLLKMSIYDRLGNLLKSYDYSSDDSVKWLQFGEGSLASMQYNYICLNIKRNLGY